MIKRHVLQIITVAWFSILSACRLSPEDGQLEFALTRASSNRLELEKVLAHYKGDSLKYEAARFLIGNMPYHFAVESWLVGPGGDRYRPDVTLFAGREEVERHCDSLMASGYRIERRNRYDIGHIRSDYLIDHIERSFEVWAKPWARDVPFGDFCRYILPYRSQNEPLTELGKTFKERYLPMLDSAGVRTPLEACILLNSRLKQEIKYADTGSPLTVTVEDMEHSGRGTCEALCDYTVHAMRSVGIPVAVHQTVWTRMARGHVWTAVLSGGRFHDFSPGDLNPDVYPGVLHGRRYLKPAKVYRKNYEAATVTMPANDDGYVTFLKSPLLEDVTEEQKVKVYTLRVPVEPGKEQLLYLCAFNNHQWVPVALGYRDECGCGVFRNVAGRNFFIVAEAAGRDRLRMVSVPLCTYGDGRMRMLSARGTLQHTFKKEAGVDYSLDYWDCEKHRFVSLTPDSVTDTMLFYGHIPGDALLFYRPAGADITDRVGVIDSVGVYRQSHEW